MTRSENSMENLMSEAERLGKEQSELEERNRKRAKKGRQPLPDAQERKDMEVARRRYRTGDNTTVDAADALKLFELRKSEMTDDPEDGIDEEDAQPQDVGGGQEVEKAAEQAQRAAEAARRVQDLKGGRIDHQGNFSAEGQRLEGGDKAELTSAKDAHAIWERASEGAPEAPAEPAKPSKRSAKVPLADLEAFKQDLYERLGTSFDALEQTLSDLQGRIAEIVTASTPSAPSAPVPGSGADEFKALLERKTPVVFDVGGTQMTFDAICVFHAPPCITLVSRIGSAKITPKPGASLLLSYEMDGVHYQDDPVTYLGTRFDLPMFGLSFVGFIRDAEADLMDAGAGLPAEGSNPS